LTGFFYLNFWLIEMVVVAMQNLKVIFSEAIRLFEKSDLTRCARICSEILNQGFVHAEVLHLYALCLKDTDAAQANDYFARALALSPDNFTLVLNYANCLLSTNNLSQAKDLFEGCTVVMPDNFDVLYGLAYIYNKQKQFEKSSFYIEKAMSKHTRQARFFVLKARVLLEQYKLDDALQTILAAEKIAQNYNVVVTKGLILRHLRQVSAAMMCLDSLPDTIEVCFMKGCVYYDAGDYEKAEFFLLKAIESDENYIEAHESLNKMYWESDLKTKFLKSYSNIFEKKKFSSIGMYLSYAKNLFMSGDVVSAENVIKIGLDNFGRQHSLLHALGGIALSEKNYEKAFLLYKESLSQNSNVRYILDFASTSIRVGKLSLAQQWLDKALALEPNNQEVIAYRGLCFRLTGDIQHYNWLNNYDDYVSVEKLPTPAGYASFSEFWYELKLAIIRLHKTTRQPLDQSVRNGTQTVGYLFSSPDPIIQTYKALIETHVQNYLNKLPLDNHHPLLQRNTGRFRFSGAWSVKLGNAGFHTNHVHPEGWLSLCTYLDVPPSINKDDPTQAGWLKLGETALSVDNAEKPDRTICPEEGLCVIFPSFIWHGTIPFSADGGHRMTLPCDIVPVLII
jgi:tetratricopeptide (TPR) repeat protein